MPTGVSSNSEELWEKGKWKCWSQQIWYKFAQTIKDSVFMEASWSILIFHVADLLFPFFILFFFVIVVKNMK